MEPKGETKELQLGKKQGQMTKLSCGMEPHNK